MITVQQQSISPPAAAPLVDRSPAGGTPLATPLATTSNLRALGAELQSYLAHPERVSIGQFAGVVEQLHGEFTLICGEMSEPALLSRREEELSTLFEDVGTRDLSATDICQLEAALNLV